MKNNLKIGTFAALLLFELAGAVYWKTTRAAELAARHTDMQIAVPLLFLTLSALLLGGASLFGVLSKKAN